MQKNDYQTLKVSLDGIKYIVYEYVKGQLGVSLTVYPWCLLCSLRILGDYNPQIPTI